MEIDIQKKTEKISQAIYLVSRHLKDSEPLKWELRKEGISLLACARGVVEEGGLNDISPDMSIEALSSCAKDLTALLSLALISGLISRNNASLIISELDMLLSIFRQGQQEQITKAGFVLSDEFFRQLDRIDKGQNSSKPLGDSARDVKDGLENINSKVFTVKDKKDSRQDKIIEILKGQSNLTIKDFVRVIKDCSEKTIQRELISLVEKGIVKRDGERRWSTYSLNVQSNK